MEEGLIFYFTSGKKGCRLGIYACKTGVTDWMDDDISEATIFCRKGPILQQHVLFAGIVFQKKYAGIDKNR